MAIRSAICSHSLGRAWVHELPEKLDQAARYGFDIEFFHEDLLYIAKRLPGGPAAENQIRAAHIVRSLCDERNLKIVCLQPFMHYEGLVDRQLHAQRVEEMKVWIRLAKILGTDLIGIPSSFLPADQVSGDLRLIVDDLRKVADLGALEGIRYAYEAISWGTHVNTWEQSWEVVLLVDRPNFGLCLDTFNIGARIYADPAAASGKLLNADTDLDASLERLIRTVDPKRISFVQVVDGERLREPLDEHHEYFEASQPARMSWSRNCRLFYGEENRGAYLPVAKILRALLVDLGYKGYLSAELFNKSLAETGSGVPEEHAKRAAESRQKMLDDFSLTSAMDHIELIEATSPPRAQL